jgi:hypothetical protein
VNLINAQPPSLYFSATGAGKTGPDLYRIAADGTLTAVPVGTGSAGSTSSRSITMRCCRAGKGANAPCPPQQTGQRRARFALPYSARSWPIDHGAAQLEHTTVQPRRSVR